ncbi:MAG: hypothetical protein PSV13_00885 [Lacunisphaera sp.]|nr:hypothetical protein [Lacunisphaera sp.]
MKDIQELQRLASPTPKPQALAWDGAMLWLSGRDNQRLFAVNPLTWTVGWETATPGTAWGLAAVNGELRAVCGETAEDHRFIRRCLPGHGFDEKFKLPCPDDMGSHLSFDGRTLYLSQWYPKKLIALGDDGRAGRIIQVPHGICGQVFVDGCFYLVTTDAEETTDYWLTRVDPRPATPKIEDLARIPFQARALAFDGKNFWTNHREQDQIVSFARPE